MNRSQIVTIVGTLASTSGVSAAGLVFNQPFLAIVGGILLIVLAAMGFSAFVTFLPILAERERMVNAVKREGLGRPPDHEP